MTFRFLIAFCSLAAAGCAVQRTAPIEAPTASTTTATPEPAQAPALPPVPADAAVDRVPGTALAPVSAPSAATGGPPAAIAPETAATPAKPAALTSPAAAAAPTDPAGNPTAFSTAPDSRSAPIASQPSADTLDFTSLGARLRTTKAIGVLTKLSVKNQADDLLDQFRDYYKRQGTATLPDLHRSYDMLVLKLLSLLHDGDPPLAMDIDRSRAAIWEILSDQRKFIASNLMAGASP